jgi:aspartokinase
MGLTQEEFQPCLDLLQELKTILEGTRMLGEVSSRIRARVLGFGELCSSSIGNAFLGRELSNQVGCLYI